MYINNYYCAGLNRILALELTWIGSALCVGSPCCKSGVHQLENFCLDLTTLAEIYAGIFMVQWWPGIHNPCPFYEKMIMKSRFVIPRFVILIVIKRLGVRLGVQLQTFLIYDLGNDSINYPIYCCATKIGIILQFRL